MLKAILCKKKTLHSKPQLLIIVNSVKMYVNQCLFMCTCEMPIFHISSQTLVTES